MAIKLHNSKWLLLALLSLAGVSGCFCQAVPLPGERHCPTDARRLYCTCGEEAVRRCPCGTDSQFYGLKPTCWREWPEGWQCNGCEGYPYVDRNSCGAPVAEAHDVESSESEQLSNPFQSMPGTSEPPRPSSTPSTAPKQRAPVQTAPVQLLPPQPTPAATPALEKIRMETAPADNNSATETPAEKSTIVVFVPPNTPVAAPRIAPAAISPTSGRAEDPALSNRVEEHLLNNLRL